MLLDVPLQLHEEKGIREKLIKRACHPYNLHRDQACYSSEVAIIPSYVSFKGSL